MPLSLVQLENELLSHLGVDVSDFTNGLTDVDLLLNRSWWEIMDKFKFKEKEAHKTFNLTPGTASYSIATLVSPILFDALQTVAIEDLVTFEHSMLDEIQIQEYESRFINTTNQQTKPTNYIRDMENGNLLFYATPDLAYPITLYYWQILSDIPSQGLSVPQSWHEIVLFGAIARGFRRFGDYNRADKAEKFQNNKIETSTPVEAKELSNLPHAGLTVIGRDY